MPHLRALCSGISPPIIINNSVRQWKNAWSSANFILIIITTDEKRTELLQFSNVWIIVRRLSISTCTDDADAMQFQILSRYWIPHLSDYIKPAKFSAKLAGPKFEKQQSAILEGRSMITIHQIPIAQRSHNFILDGHSGGGDMQMRSWSNTYLKAKMPFDCFPKLVIVLSLEWASPQ